MRLVKIMSILILFSVFQSCIPPARTVTGRMPESTGAPGSGAIDLGASYEVPLNSELDRPIINLEPQILVSVHPKVDLDFNVMMYGVGLGAFANSWIGSVGAHYRAIQEKTVKLSIGGGLILGGVNWGDTCTTYDDDEEDECDDHGDDWGFVWGTFVQFDYGFRLNDHFGIYFGNNLIFSLAGSAPLVLYGVHGIGTQINWSKSIYSSFEFGIIWNALDGAPPFSCGPSITIIGYNW